MAWKPRDAKGRGALVAQVLSQAWRTSPPALHLSSADLALVAPVLLESHAAPLVWNKLREDPSSEESLLQSFRDVYRFSALHSEMRSIDLTGVLATMRAGGVEPIVHKGWATARLYPCPEMRSYSDIDLLIRPDLVQVARGVLAAQPAVSCHIDLEHSEITQLDSVGFDALYARSLTVKLGTHDVRILGLEDHLRSLCIHCLKHGAGSAHWLVDVAATIESLPAEFDWQLCIGERQPQANWVRSALSLAHRLLDADIRNTPIAEFLPELPGWLVRSVLRRWSLPPVPGRLPRLAAALKSRTGLLEALVWRWPSAAASTVNANAQFTRFPNIHLQLQSRFRMATLKTFVSQFPEVWRNAK